MKIIITFIAICLLLTGYALNAQEKMLDAQKRPLADSEVIPVCLSEDERFTLITSKGYDGLAIVNNETGEIRRITGGRNAGYYAGISPDNQYVSYKKITVMEDGIQQVPKLYDIVNDRNIPLAGKTNLCGTPSIAPDGKIAYTVGDTLIILNPDFSVYAEYLVPGHINIVHFSSDSKFVAFNPEPNTLSLIDIRSGDEQVLIQDEFDMFNPQFSPDGKKLMVQAVDSRVVVMNLFEKKLYIPGTGYFPGWLDENTVAYTQYAIEGKRIKKTYLVVADTETQTRRGYELGDKHVSFAAGSKNIVYYTQEALYILRVDQDTRILQREIPLKKDTHKRIFKELPQKQYMLPGTLSTEELEGVPQIHQVYDTPSGFNGHAACGATSALMAIQYYELLPARSPSGWYVSNIYTYNDVTYDQWANDPNRNQAYGGYGYIAQDTGWYGGPNRGNDHTSVWMRRYFENHGLESAVDWSTTWAKVTREINNEDPFVVLFTNRFTSGHYITATGYVEGQYTVIFNDPYGDQNTSGWPSNDGKRVFYDWPGYNYGNENLNTVHCYIYARGDFRPPSTLYNMGDWVETTAGSLNFRNAPGTDSGVIRTLPRGTLARILDHEEMGIFVSGYYWWYVEVDTTGETGWLAQTFLELTSSPCDVSIPDQPYGPDTGAVYEALSFTTGGSECTCGSDVEYRFDWGDGTTSSWSQDAMNAKTWNTGGSYAVRARARCTVENSVESDWSQSMTVMIYEPPVAEFASDKRIAEPYETIQFSDLSSGDIESREWDFGDGNTSTETEPGHSYSEIGSYTVSLTLSGPAGSDTVVHEEYIHVLETVYDYNARLESYVFPEIMLVGNTYEAALTLRNTGIQSWEREDNVYLGAIGDKDEITPSEYWRVGADITVKSGDAYTFGFTVQPQKSGNFVSEWSMLKEGVFWFGDAFIKEIRVDDRTSVDRSIWYILE